MSDYKQYKRKEVAELRVVSKEDLEAFKSNGELKFISEAGWYTVYISEADLVNMSPKIGDMIARNPKNYLDQWLVAEQYFEDNFEDAITSSNKN